MTSRVVVTDDNVQIRVTIYPYGVTEPLAVAELSPEQAVRLCAELSMAASRHLLRRVGIVVK